MEEIRILHFSDILAGSSDRSISETLKNLKEWVKTSTRKERVDYRVDYIVVCGNIVAECKRDNFDKAREILEDLTRDLLVLDKSRSRHETELRLNRLFVVPGPNDVPFGDNGQNFDEFKRFHDELFQKEVDLGRVEPFDPEKAICRELKDLTLLGISYWFPRDKTYRPLMLDSLSNVIQQVKDQLSSIDYANCTPTLLISAGTPLFNLDEENLVTLRRMQDIFDDLKVTLHLIGSGKVAGILPEPYIFKHISLGTGPRNENNFWPFRANLIELRTNTMRGERITEKASFLKNHVFQQISNNESFKLLDFIDGHLDPFFKKEGHSHGLSNDHIYSRFLALLDKEMFEYENAFIRITGLPVSGKEKFFNFITEESRRWGEHEVIAIGIVLRNYKDESYIDALQDINKIKKQWPNKKVVVAFRDLYLPKLHNSEKSDKFENFINDIIPLLKLKYKADGALYFLPTGFFNMGYDPAGRDFSKKKALLLLDENEIKILTKKYSCKMPVVVDYLKALTGGHIGFSDLILKAYQDEFINISGAEPIHEKNCSLLMEKVLQSNERIMEETNEIFQILEPIDENPVITYIIDKIKKLSLKEEKGISKYPKPGQININVGEIKQKYKSYKKIDLTIDMLKESNIISEHDKNRQIYYLEVIAPFLVVMEQRHLANRVEKTSLGHESGHSNFLSKEQEQVNRVDLMNKLNSLAPQLFDQIIFVIKPPAGIVPSTYAAQGDRTFALLTWAEGIGGCGLSKIQQELETMIKSGHNLDHSPTGRNDGQSRKNNNPLQEEIVTLASILSKNDKKFLKERLKKTGSMVGQYNRAAFCIDIIDIDPDQLSFMNENVNIFVSLLIEYLIDTDNRQSLREVCKYIEESLGEESAFLQKLKAIKEKL